jgi:hypothetical protein
MRADKPGVEIDFFGAPGLYFAQWKKVDGGIWPEDPRADNSFKMTSGGLSAISGDYDAYFIIGMGFGLYNLFRIKNGHRTRTTFNPRRHQLISDACLRRCAQGMTIWQVATATALRAQSSAPVSLMPNPLPGASRMADFLRDDGAFLAEIADVIAEVAAGLAFPVLAQPPQTVVGRHFTDAIFARRSCGLEGEAHAEDDFVHMNAEFGAAVLAAVLPAG